MDTLSFSPELILNKIATVSFAQKVIIREVVPGTGTCGSFQPDKRNSISPLTEKDDQLINEFLQLSEFASYKLNACDILILAWLWSEYLTDSRLTFKWRIICETAKKDTDNTRECLIYMISLLDREVISFSKDIKEDYHLNPLALLAEEFTLNKGILLKILGYDVSKEISRLISENWSTDQDFITDLKLCLNALFEGFGEFDAYYYRKNRTMLSSLFSDYFTPFLEKISLSSDHLEIVKLIKEYNLNRYELCALLVFLYFQLTQDEYLTISEFCTITCQSRQEKSRASALFSPSSLLIREGLLQFMIIPGLSSRRALFLPDELKNRLCGQSSENLCSLNSYLYGKKEFRLIETGQTLQDLIIPTHDLDLLKSLKDFYSNRQALHKWGFEIKATGVSNGFIALFYGEPGTGKTYAAGALANTLNRKLISIDCSALRDPYYGETEKIIRKTFRLMREMSARFTDSLVFLINEADQLIHKRNLYPGESSRPENSLQNIILEEMETFQDILILTTNLHDNIDEAYFRRFHLKLRFNLPDNECRRKLWQLHLHQKIPGISRIDTNFLANYYHFSGGQIALVIKNSCIEAINRKGIQKKLTQKDLIKYANLEKEWSSVKNGRNVGFHKY